MTTQSLQDSRRPASVVWAGVDGFAVEYQDALLLIARILIGWIFVQSGLGKLMDINAFAASLARNGVPAPTLFAYIGAPVEFVGGLALLTGLATRYAAALMILFVIVATLIAHRYWQITDAAQHRVQEINFYKNVAIMGGILSLFVAGGGRLSIDGLLHRRR